MDSLLQIEHHGEELDLIREMRNHGAGAANSWHRSPGEFCDSSGNKWDSRGSSSWAEDEAHASFESQPISDETAWQGVLPDASDLQPTLPIPNVTISAILAGACMIMHLKNNSTFDWDNIRTHASLLAHRIQRPFLRVQRQMHTCKEVNALCSDDIEVQLYNNMYIPMKAACMQLARCWHTNTRGNKIFIPPANTQYLNLCGAQV